MESRFQHRSRGKSTTKATPEENTGVPSSASAPSRPAGDALSQCFEELAPASEPPRNTPPDGSVVVGALPPDTVGAISVIPEETVEENTALLMDGETQGNVRGNDGCTGNNKTGKHTGSTNNRGRGVNTLGNNRGRGVNTRASYPTKIPGSYAPREKDIIASLIPSEYFSFSPVTWHYWVHTVIFERSDT